MKADAKSKYLLDQFQTKLEESWKKYQLTHGVPDNNAQFVTYLIDNNLISSRTIRKYTIMHEYHARMDEGKASKTAIVNSLSARYRISERSIWYLLSKD
ncbi:MAG: hypothetical protein AAFZ63_20665 [Bacteroidota bacterium]